MTGNNMQILKIKLSDKDQTEIFNELINRFNTEDKRQTIEFEWLNDDFVIESVLELYTEGSEPDENNQSEITYRSIVKFSITFFHDGDEVSVEDWRIDDRIAKYYEK
jgi:hypothetical protein